ncbi:MAG: serine hydrolase [Streptosporangiales bacterium]
MTGPLIVSMRALDPELAAAPGRVSVWCGPPGKLPAYTRLPDETHDAASTMKLAVLVAAYRLADAGRLDLDAAAPVHDEFASADGRSSFRVDSAEDGDDLPWQRLGESVPLRWLLQRMIVRSSNLATDLVLEQVGYGPVAEAWRICGATRSVVERPINDYAAGGEGKRNIVTAADLAAVVGAIALDRAAAPASCAAMRQTLAANEYNPDIPAGLPAGTWVGHKNGWVDGIRHDAALVAPDSAEPYVLVVCTSSELSDAEACALVARVAAASYRDAVGSTM